MTTEASDGANVHGGTVGADPRSRSDFELEIVPLEGRPIIGTSSGLGSTRSASATGDSEIQEDETGPKILDKQKDRNRCESSDGLVSESDCGSGLRSVEGQLLIIEMLPSGSRGVFMPEQQDHTSASFAIERELAGMGNESEDSGMTSGDDSLHGLHHHLLYYIGRKWVKVNVKIFRFLIFAVLFLSIVLIGMTALGQLEDHNLVRLSTGITYEQVTKVRKDITGSSIAFCAIWGILGCLQVFHFAAVVHRTLIKPCSGKQSAHADSPSNKSCSSFSAAEESDCGRMITLLKHLGSPLHGLFFWHAQAVGYFLSLVLQMEALSVYSGYSFLLGQNQPLVQDAPIVITHAALLGVLFATIPVCFLRDERFIAVLCSLICNLGFSLDRLLLVSAAINRSWLSYWVFKQESWPQLFSALLPAFNLWRGLRMLERAVTEVEQQRLPPPGDTDTPAMTERQGKAAAARPSCAPLRRTARVWLLGAPFVLASMCFVAFTVRQLLFSDCSHVAATCEWIVHPLWSFPACDCHVVVQPTYNASAGACVDFHAEISALKATRLQWITLGITPPTRSDCAVTDGPFYALLRAYPMLTGIAAPYNKVELADQAGLPPNPHLVGMDLTNNPVTLLSGHLLERWSRSILSLNFEYSSIAEVTDDFAAGMNFGIWMHGTPLCRNTERMAELARLTDRPWTGLECRAVFTFDGGKAVNEGKAVNVSQYACEESWSASLESAAQTLETARTRCVQFFTKTGPDRHACSDECKVYLPFISTMDTDKDRNLNFEEGKQIISGANLFPGLEITSEAQLTCLVTPLSEACESRNPVRGMLDVRSLMIVLTTGRTDCRDCPPAYWA